jgi:hypothetical protein
MRVSPTAACAAQTQTSIKRLVGTPARSNCAVASIFWCAAPPVTLTARDRELRDTGASMADVLSTARDTLHREHATMSVVLYRNHNQHRRTRAFRAFRSAHKAVGRLLPYLARP